MANTFVTLCDGPYEENRQILNSIALNYNFKISSLKLSDLEQNFLNEIKNILQIKRGLGLCVWKPHIILECFKEMEFNEYVIYMDSADMIHPEIFNYISNSIQTQDIILVPSPLYNIQSKMTKRDCFVLMGCDSEEYWNATQIEAGLIVAKKTQQTIKILNEWQEYCKNENILTDIPNICGLDNFSNFLAHRHDQSILSNLAVKYNIQLDEQLLRFIRHNIV